jgi:hypothetical protein
VDDIELQNALRTFAALANKAIQRQASLTRIKDLQSRAMSLNNRVLPEELDKASEQVQAIVAKRLVVVTDLDNVKKQLDNDIEKVFCPDACRMLDPLVAMDEAGTLAEIRQEIQNRHTPPMRPATFNKAIRLNRNPIQAVIDGARYLHLDLPEVDLDPLSAKLDAIEGRIKEAEQEDGDTAEKAAVETRRAWLEHKRSLATGQKQPEGQAKLEPAQQQQERAEPNISPVHVEIATRNQQTSSTQRGPKKHEYTQFILNRWDKGERNREVIYREFVKILPASKRRTDEEARELFKRWWENAAKHRREMWSQSR